MKCGKFVLVIAVLCTASASVATKVTFSREYVRNNVPRLQQRIMDVSMSIIDPADRNALPSAQILVDFEKLLNEIGTMTGGYAPFGLKGGLSAEHARVFKEVAANLPRWGRHLRTVVNEARSLVGLDVTQRVKSLEQERKRIENLLDTVAQKSTSSTYPETKQLRDLLGLVLNQLKLTYNRAIEVLTQIKGSRKQQIEEEKRAREAEEKKKQEELTRALLAQKAEKERKAKEEFERRKKEAELRQKRQEEFERKQKEEREKREKLIAEKIKEEERKAAKWLEQKKAEEARQQKAREKAEREAKAREEALRKQAEQSTQQVETVTRAEVEQAVGGLDRGVKEAVNKIDEYVIKNSSQEKNVDGAVTLVTLPSASELLDKLKAVVDKAALFVLGYKPAGLSGGLSPEHKKVFEYVGNYLPEWLKLLTDAVNKTQQVEGYTALSRHEEALRKAGMFGPEEQRRALEKQMEALTQRLKKLANARRLMKALSTEVKKKPQAKTYPETLMIRGLINTVVQEIDSVFATVMRGLALVGQRYEHRLQQIGKES